ncbi:MAG: AAA family ATPase [Alphaproteobacteria bacterium]|nr:AAA family ATPase [Alphaproteobacteria bacterium]
MNPDHGRGTPGGSMADQQLVAFGDFAVDLVEERLWRAGSAVEIAPKALALLAVLLDRPGRLVGKKELFERLWGGTAVSDAALSRCIRELRVALGDDAGTPRYIATLYGRGLRFIAPVSHRATATPASSGATLVGRAREIAQLGEAMREVRDGARRAVFVTGEAGIGKTSLVEAILGQPAADGVWVGRGRCIEQFGAVEAHLPIIEALETLSRQAGDDRLGAVLARYAPAWLGELPWLAGRIDPTELARARAGATARRMVREIAHALEVLSAERPIVLWLEDLHWCDYASLDVIALLAGRREPARILLVATYRPDELDAPRAPLRALTHRLESSGHVRELALGYLDEASVAAYLSTRFADAPDALRGALARFIHSRSSGNPLHMTAIAEDLVRREVLRRSAEGWTARMPIDAGSLDLPHSLRQLIEQQFAQLDEPDRDLLLIAAAVGESFSAAALAIDPGADLAAIEERCMRLARRGRFLRPRDPVLWPDGTEAAGFAFVHALYRQALDQLIPESRRAPLHRRIGERIERGHGDLAATVAVELATHFEKARDLPRAQHYLALAGRGALMRHAYLEGIELMNRALAMIDALPAADRPRRELELLLPLGAALMAAKGYAASEVDACYRRALALCRADAARPEVARVIKGMWNVALVRAELDRAQDLAKELLDHAAGKGDTALAFDAHGKLGQTALHKGELVAARRHLEAAMSALTSLPSRSPPAEAPRVAAYLAWVVWYLGFPALALEHGRRALVLAREIGNPHSSAFALGFVAWLHHLRGETDRLLELANEQHALATENGLPYWLAWSRFLREIAASRGSDGRATLAAIRAAIDDGRVHGAEVGIVHFLVTAAETCRHKALAADGLALLDVAEALMNGNGNRYHAAELHRVRGEMRRLRGDDREAERCFRRALEIARHDAARALELRAATSLHQLRRDAGSQALLAQSLASFEADEGSADLAAARALLTGAHGTGGE